MTFYIDGLQVDVQDPLFFMDEEEYIDLEQTLEEMLYTYANISMDKQNEKQIL